MPTRDMSHVYVYATLVTNSCPNKTIQNTNGTSVVLQTVSHFLQEANRHLSMTLHVCVCVCGERVLGRQEGDWEAGSSFPSSK